MMNYMRSIFGVGLASLMIAVAVLMLNGCGSSPPSQQGPAGDAELERFNRAARQAFDKGQFRQAANFYRLVLDRAYVRDDTAAILDARYNLAVCLLNMNSYDEALEVVRRAGTEKALAGQDNTAEFLLLEATILHRRGDHDEAWLITDQILSSQTKAPQAIRSRTHFLRGLIASDRDDMDQLRASIAALGQPQNPKLRADRQELSGRLSMAEQNWDAAIEAFDAAISLRRETVDYREMLRALVWSGEASEKAGRLREAAIRYLRAGRSAFLQDQFDDALRWLNRAVELAGAAGEDQISQEALHFLRQVEALNAAANRGS